jgi:excisionase family DNA binding protein
MYTTSNALQNSPGHVQAHGPQPDGTFPTILALAQYLRLSERSTRAHLRKGLIPHRKLGKRYIVSRAAVDRWLSDSGREAA